MTQHARNTQSVTVGQRPPVTITATTTHVVCLAVIAISRLLTPCSQVLQGAVSRSPTSWQSGTFLHHKSWPRMWWMTQFTQLLEVSFCPLCSQWWVRQIAFQVFKFV